MEFERLLPKETRALMGVIKGLERFMQNRKSDEIQNAQKFYDFILNKLDKLK